MPIRLITADDHPLILDSLDSLFQLEKDFQVVARCQDGMETLRAVRIQQADILILDIRMPGKNGLEVLREMHEEHIPRKVVLLTGELDDEELIEAMHLGVQGIILEEMAPLASDPVHSRFTAGTSGWSIDRPDGPWRKYLGGRPGPER